MKNLFFSLISIMLMCVSCSQDVENIPYKQNLSDNSLNLFGEYIEQIDGTLKFSDKSSLENVLDNLMRSQEIMTKSADNGLIQNSDYVISEKNFRSIYDDYVAAMDEAHLYYDQWADYYHFKEKYSNLYFPEYGKDYSVYLPISDKNLAKLANRDGFILIGDELVDCKDIKSHEDLDEFGLSIPENNKNTRADVNSIIHYNDGENLVWINVHDQGYNAYQGKRLFKFEVCFRDKGFLGIWHNRRATTKLFASASVGQVTHSGSGQQEGMSSHDYSFGFSVPAGTTRIHLKLNYGPVSQALEGTRTYNL